MCDGIDYAYQGIAALAFLGLVILLFYVPIVLFLRGKG
jgi:hypothetical protein